MTAAGSYPGLRAYSLADAGLFNAKADRSSVKTPGALLLGSSGGTKPSWLAGLLADEARHLSVEHPVKRRRPVTRLCIRRRLVGAAQVTGLDPRLRLVSAAQVILGEPVDVGDLRGWPGRRVGRRVIVPLSALVAHQRR